MYIAAEISAIPHLLLYIRTMTMPVMETDRLPMLFVLDKQYRTTPLRIIYRELHTQNSHH